jgi:hypothetical protein
MATIGEVYNPLIKAAEANDPEGHNLLRLVGIRIHEDHPDDACTEDEGIEAAKRNLDYYCQYFSAETAAKVKEFYNLGAGFRDLSGNKYGAQA